MDLSFTAIITIIIIFTSTAVNSQSPPSVYEVLQQFDFPIGLLPKGVTKYELNNTTGDFKAYLGDACSFSLEGTYDLKYKSIIEGRIYKDKLTKLQGVSVKVVLLWMDITEVRRNGEQLEFSVGIKSANFPMDNFELCPQCGCGFHCDNREEFASSN